MPVHRETLHPFFATVARGVEPLLATELTELGATAVRLSRGGVNFRGPLAVGYRVCLWSRLASRVILNLARLAAQDGDTLYAATREIPWEEHISPQGSLAVDFTGTNPRIQHTVYGGQRVKDAVVDRLRDRFGVRPDVRPHDPDVRIHARLAGDAVWIGLDLAGDSLHRRGYREVGGPAPLKETLAAAILRLADWPTLARERWPFLDPMCGSGTLAIEAALMAGDVAPGLLRGGFGGQRWLQHQPAIWQALWQEAEGRRQFGNMPAILGWDKDPHALTGASRNLARAGLSQAVKLEPRDIADLSPPFAKGLLAVNPPYGERLGDQTEVTELHRLLGEGLSRFAGWRLAVFSASPALGRLAIPGPVSSHPLYNGPIACTLWLGGDMPRQEVRPSSRPAAPVLLPVTSLAPGGGAAMFANRLNKNWKHRRKWAALQGITCYRLYDADLPEYAVVVDLYESWAMVQEYRAPAEVDPAMARQRLADVLWAVPQVLAMPAEQVVLKIREKAKGGSQYPKQAERQEFLNVQEGGLRFLVNLHDYLDTGLFLDHRLTRAMIRELAPGRRFLNLFGYTGSATVYAAAGNAQTTTTVDLSNTYLDWAWRNLTLNRLDAPRHALVRADCLAWLEQARETYDLIFLDPPTFSNSAAMATPFVLQRDHDLLLTRALQRLAAGGTLLFSCNFKKFQFNSEVIPAGWTVAEITRQTMPEDFRRSPNIHRCWRIHRP